MGLSHYASHSPGVGGILKLTPDAFRVDEISRYPPPSPEGRFTIVRVESFEIEQNELLHRLSQELFLPPGQIEIAGTKDRRAITTQLISMPVDPERIRHTLLNGVRILDCYRATEGLHLGYLYGNFFQIRVQGIEGDAATPLRRVRAIETELREAQGFPNFFGPQRFGEVRPVTHLVGRALVRGSVSDAVQAYLTVHAEGERGDGSEARRRYRVHQDPQKALEEFPRALRFERVLLDRLARGDSAERAFGALPRHLRTLFVHAFQSYLFNRTLSLRMERGLPLNEPTEGDWMIRLGYDGLPGSLAPVLVTRDNLPEMQHLSSSGRARIANPIVGTETPASIGPSGELVEEVLKSEGVERKNFHLPTLPGLSSEGTYRAVLGHLPRALFPRGGPRVEDGALDFSFPLEKGEYATVLLREFTKSDGLPRE